MNLHDYINIAFAGAAAFTALINLSMYFRGRKGLTELLVALFSLALFAYYVTLVLAASALGEGSQAFRLLRTTNLFLGLLAGLWLLYLHFFLALKGKVALIVCLSLIAAALLLNYLIPQSVMFSQENGLHLVPGPYGGTLAISETGFSLYRLIIDIIIIILSAGGMVMVLLKLEKENFRILVRICVTLSIVFLMGLFDHLVDYGYFFFNHLVPYGLFALLSISGLEYVSHAFHERKSFLEMSIRLHYLQTFLEDAGLIVVRLNRTGHVAFVNPFFLQLTDYQEKEVLGKDWFETFVPKTTQFDVQGVFLQVVQHKFYKNYRNSILTSSGEEKLIEWFNVRLYDQANKITGTLSVGIDITDQDKRHKELEHDLAEARALADRLRTELKGL